MFSDQERSVVLVTTRTSFEAEVIAQALRERGVNARVLGEPQLPLGGAGASGGAGGSSGAKVMVLESEEDFARQALENVKAESSRVNWEEAEFDEDPEAAREVRRAVNRQSRVVLTLGVIFMPVGLAVLMYGTMFSNPMVRIVGGAVVVSAVIMIGKGMLAKDA